MSAVVVTPLSSVRDSSHHVLVQVLANHKASLQMNDNAVRVDAVIDCVVLCMWDASRCVINGVFTRVPGQDNISVLTVLMVHP